MVISVAVRSTSLRSKEEWQSRLARVMPRIEAVLKSQPGFVSAEFRWGVHGDGQVANVTCWQTDADAVRYVRGGGAATVDALDQSVVPPIPDFRNGPRRFTYSEPDVTIRV